MFPAPTTIATSTPRSRTAATWVAMPVDLGGVGAVVEAAHQGLPGELQEDPREALLGRRVIGHQFIRSRPGSSEKRAMRMFSPVFAASSWRSSSIVFEPCFSALTCS